MLTKIISRGEGNGYGPVKYLCDENPFGRGKREIPPKVISGNPAIIRRQIDAVPFKYKYTSGVHSFAPEDNPTDEQILEVIEATEELAFAGLPESSKSILWVKHEQDGRIDLHFLIPRQEVNIGKAFNAFPPGWQQKYDHLGDKFNYKYGWARPDDPERARHWQPGINAKILQDAKRKEKPNPKAVLFSLTDDLANMAMQGKLANRSEIVSELRKRGYGINRLSKDYLTIVDKDGKKTRLKGTLFAENFNGSDWIKAEIAKIDKPDTEKVLIDRKLAEEAGAKLQEAIRKTAIYNSQRYAIEEDYDDKFTEKSTNKWEERAYSGGNAEKDRLGDESAHGAGTTWEESFKRKADETNPLYSQQGLGKSPANGSGATLREDVQSALREIPFSEQSLSGMGGREGERPPLERRNRGKIECIPEGRDRASQDTDKAGAGDYRWQPGKPGGYDETDLGQSERIARQSERPGEFWCLIEDLKRNAEKLKNRLHSMQQQMACAYTPTTRDSELNLDQAVLAQAGKHLIQQLAAVYEKNILRAIAHSLPKFQLEPTTGLLIEAEKATRALRQLKEFNLLKKINKNFPTLKFPSADILSIEAENLGDALKRVNEHNLLKNMTKFVPSFQCSDLSLLENQGRILENRLGQVYEAKIAERVALAERKRQKIIARFMRQAKWAGDDLGKWEYLEEQYGKHPKRLKIMNSLFDRAHSQFAAILQKNNKLGEIEELCEHDPLLMREFAILEDMIEKYREENKEQASDVGAFRNGMT